MKRSFEVQMASELMTDVIFEILEDVSGIAVFNIIVSTSFTYSLKNAMEIK